MKRFAPATERNSTPILEVLRQVLPEQGTVLEIASGTGQHAVFFAPLFPALTWQPTDLDPDSLESIESWLLDAGTPNIGPPLRLDVTSDSWPVTQADAVVCCNMIHIAPWQACEGLFVGGARILSPGAPLFLYGPFLQIDVPTSPSNLEFDATLRGRNPAWGIRALDDVCRVAAANGFRFARKIAMPANNLSVVFQRAQ